MDPPQHPPSPSPMRLCGFCHKPFLKETSYNRHVLYCRRAQNRPRMRARSCRACSMAKVKCNFQPRCLRCTKKGLDCVYDTPMVGANAPRTPAADAHLSEGTPSVLTPSSASSGDMAGPLDDLGASTADEAHIDVDWNTLDFGATDLLTQSPPNSLPSFEDVPRAMAVESFLSGNRDGTGFVMDGLDGAYGPDHLSLAKLPWSAWSTRNDHPNTLAGPSPYLSERPSSQFLALIPRSDPVATSTVNVVMQMLCAFPQMTLRRETLPPFIHGHWYRSTSATEPALPTPLVNCMGIAQVFASHNPDTRPFLWRTVRTELRFWAAQTEQGQISRHDLLAAIQAQMIYILMRVNDNDPKIEPDLNLEMLVTYQRLCESFKALCNQPFCQDERSHPSSSWEDWVFAESRRRTTIVWLLITQMVYIKIGVPCDNFDGFRDVPLPCPKALWEARTRAQWQAEYEHYGSMLRTGFDRIGDLLDACKNGEAGLNRMKLNAWNATADNLGVLLNMGAALM